MSDTYKVIMLPTVSDVTEEDIKNLERFKTLVNSSEVKDILTELIFAYQKEGESPEHYLSKDKLDQLHILFNLLKDIE